MIVGKPGKAGEMRKKWTDLGHISEVKSIELVDGLHVGGKGVRESRVTCFWLE